MNKDELLYHYFSNTLPPDQKKKFEELLENDADFKARFEFENDLKIAIGDKEKQDLKAKLIGFENEITSHKKAIQKRFVSWRIAASLALLITTGWFGYNTFFKVDYNKIYEVYYQDYPNVVYTITRGDTTNSSERKAFVAYELKDYKNAITHFESISSEVYKTHHDFYKALSYLNLEDVENARSILESVAAKENKFTDKANWYLALLHLKMKDKAKAKEHFETLINNYSYKTDKAKELLKKLD